MSDLETAARAALEAMRPVVTEGARLEPPHSFACIKVKDLDRVTVAFVDLRRALANKTAPTGETND
jgi:hypothetical protein